MSSLIIGLSSQSVYADRIDDLEARIEVLTQTLEERQTASNSVSIGGYGELHYNNLENGDGSEKDAIDFHRFVLFFAYDFSDSVRFVSEFELEHALAGDGKPGEVELEQAYVEFDHDSSARTQAGVFLVPVGILNETHEPPTFYGVERNDVENIIIPSTWWEAGVQHIRQFGEGWEWNIALHSGLAMPTTGSSAFRVRSGRQKVAEADASNFAATTRIKYTGIPGLEVAASLQIQDDPSQVESDGLDDGTLTEIHAIYNKGAFGLRALYANWDFSGTAVEAAANEADSQDGWYVEPSFKVSDEFGVYVRLSEVDGVRVADEFEQTQIGFNWWPVESVAIKFDIIDRENETDSDRDQDGFNVGIGYQF